MGNCENGRWFSEGLCCGESGRSISEGVFVIAVVVHLCVCIVGVVCVHALGWGGGVGSILFLLCSWLTANDGCVTHPKTF